MTVPVIGIVGPSNSGKTRVAVALIEELAAHGLRVGAIKHAPHGQEIDRPGTDSARLFAAGAQRVVVSSPQQMATIARTEGDAALEEVVASLDPGYDLVVAEGFKRSTVPKVLVLGREPISPPPENVIAVVGDAERVDGLPCYTFQEMAGLADLVRDQVLGQASDAPAVLLKVDGVTIPMAPFPASALAGVLKGFLSSLKDIPGEPQSIHVTLHLSARGRGRHIEPVLTDAAL